jgi:hypothetical protein
MGMVIRIHFCKKYYVEIINRIKPMMKNTQIHIFKFEYLNVTRKSDLNSHWCSKHFYESSGILFVKFGCVIIFL